jgi:hypothetical protein
VGHVVGVVKSMRPYDACGGAERCIQGFAWWSLGVDGGIILKCILKKLEGWS